MPRISTDNYDTVASWNGSQDLFVVEQPDGTKVATPAMVKQYVLNNMDEVPTQDSNNPVKSGGIFSAVDDVYSVMGEMGAKNLIPYPYNDTTRTTNGITFTDNGDGTVTVNGTATGNVNFWCIRYEEDFIFPEGKYILSAGGVGNDKVYVFLANYNNTTWKRQYNITDGGEIAVTVQHSGDYNRTPIGISVNSGATVNNLTFKPMLRLASNTDNTYRPYAKTNKELTNGIDDVYKTMGEMGAKNLIPYPYYETTHTENGVTFTDNGDGTVTANTGGSAATGNATFFCGNPNNVSNLIKLDKNKTYIFSDTTHGGIANNCVLGIRYYAEGVVPSTTSGTNANCTVSNNWQVTVTNAVYAYVYVYVWSGKTVSNLTFKPLLRLAADTDNTYQSYVKTNRQLTEEIGDLSQTGVTGDTVADQLKSIKNVITFDKVPDSFITLQSGISIVTNQVYKQGNHIFGWITFGFSAQTPSTLKLGVLNSGYRPSGISRMMVGLGTQPWTSEYAGYCLRDSDYSLSVTGYNNNIRAVHIHLDYVI